MKLIKELNHTETFPPGTDPILSKSYWAELYFGRPKQKSTFEHAQNAAHIQILLHMRKVSYGHLLFINTFWSIQQFC